MDTWSRVKCKLALTAFWELTDAFHPNGRRPFIYFGWVVDSTPNAEFEK